MTIIRVICGVIAFLCLMGAMASGQNGKAGAIMAMLALGAMYGAIGNWS